MKIVIDIPQNLYQEIMDNADEIQENGCVFDRAIINGTPLEKHDEEVIKETVESIWGKPPYTELLDKIRAEIDKRKSTIDKAISEDESKIEGLKEAYTDCLEIIDKYRAESEDTE